jgi:hypothetical protein
LKHLRGVTPLFGLFSINVLLFFCLDTKETKNQGGKLLDGGLFINAAPFEWSMTLTEGNLCLWPVPNAAKALLKTPCSRQPIQGRVINENNPFH